MFACDPSSSIQSGLEYSYTNLLFHLSPATGLPESNFATGHVTGLIRHREERAVSKQFTLNQRIADYHES